ncbi:MAG: DUF1835 domain-containing protein [Bacteroidetes bacterium]|nr:DUF1835 domain-containing protein [Bacteroidota bacterium]MBS1757518.1 DUF1835 domain-containing protein [Bacteroidota bacterium]
MIHIVFNEEDVKKIKEAITLDDTMAGEVIQIKDDYAVGPLMNIYIGEGIEARKQWWREVLAGGDYDGKVDTGEVDDYKTAAELVGGMRRNEEEIIWIWAAQNKHDVCGYYWLLQYMKEFQGRVFILYLNNLPFINEKGNIFYPNWLSEIPAKEFLKAKKLAREITLSEFEVDPDEWQKLCNENKGVRLLEGGKKLVQEDYDFYDAELKKMLTGDWQKASKVIQHFLSKAKHTTGDAYLLWRLKTLLAMEMFDVQGKVGNMKDFEVKIKTA